MDNNSQTQSYVKEKRVKDLSGLNSKVQRLGRGLMLPIAILPIAGLLLGIGAAINNSLAAFDVTSASAYFIGDVMQEVGNIVFANLAVLFAIAIAITFTDDAGGAALSALVGFLIFNAIQTPFIGDTYVLDGQNVADIAFYSGISASLFANNLGIYSLSTSVFGGIIIGSMVAYLYNKYHKIKLPTVIGFFGGIRFVPIITILYSSILGLIFVLVWPIISIAITAFGNWVTGLPWGLNSFFFGITERALIPFGLHHVFYTPLWYTSAGAVLNPDLIMIGGSQTLADLVGTTGTIDGDQSIWIFLNSNGVIGFDDVAYMAQHATGSLSASDSVYGFDLSWTDGAITQGYAPGQYMQGKFTIMIFGLPAAGAAMIMAAKKENREVAMSIIGAAALTSFLTGITEPIEFTFLFLAPMLFYGFHVPMAGISFWVLNVAGANVGLTFSGGLFDLLIYGLLPSITGNGTQFWIILVLGVVYIPIYYFVFYYYITIKDVPTPGRTNDEVKMITKEDYRNRGKDGSPSGGASDDEKPTRIEELIINLGGLDNLKTIDACATRLRLTVNNRDLINDEGLKSMGAAGVAGKGANVQVIFGGEADVLKSNLKEVQSGKQQVNQALIDRRIAQLNGQEVSAPQNVESSSSKTPTRIEELIINLGGLDNLKTIDACATRLRLTVNNRDLINESGLKSMGAAGVAGKGANVQVIFGGEADILKSNLKEVQSGKQQVDEDLIKSQIALINNLEPTSQVVEEKVESKPEIKEETKSEANIEDVKVEQVKEETKSEPKVDEVKEEISQAVTKVEEKQKEVKVKEEIKSKNEQPKVQEIKEEVSKVETKSKPEVEEKQKTEIKDFANTKENFNEAKEIELSEEDKTVASKVIEVLGGSSNIVKVSGNITRLSIKVNDRKLINEEELRLLDIKDIVGHSNNFQIVWKTEVDNIAKAINEQLK